MFVAPDKQRLTTRQRYDLLERPSVDWYDIAYVLLHNDLGGPTSAGLTVLERFGADLVGQIRTALKNLAGNFADGSAQGAEAYAEVMISVRPELDWDVLANDAVAALDAFMTALNLRR